MKNRLTFLIYILLISSGNAFIEGHPESAANAAVAARSEDTGLKRLKRIRDTLNRIKNHKSANSRAVPLDTKHEYSLPPTKHLEGENPNDLPIAPSPFVIKSGVSRKPPAGNEASLASPPTIVGLLEKCQKLGSYMQTDSSDTDRAFELYKLHCFAVISQVAIAQKLDLLYPLQTAYLDRIGEHAKANQYHTLLYQLNPRDLHTNISLARNLKNLGEIAMATELLNFFKESPWAKKLEDSERRLLLEIESELSSPQTN